MAAENLRVVPCRPIFGSTSGPRLAKTHALAAAVFGDELNPGGFKGLNDQFDAAAIGIALAPFKFAYGHNAEFCVFCKILLFPSEQAASGPALFRRNHLGKPY